MRMGTGGHTPLIHAVVSGHRHVVELLCELARDGPKACTLDLNKPCASKNRAPLQYAIAGAAKTKDMGIVELVLAEGASPVFSSKATGKPTTNALFDAIRTKNTELVSLICRRHKELLHTTSPLGWLPLQVAIWDGNADMVSTLLVAGADPREKNHAGISCFRFALGQWGACACE